MRPINRSTAHRGLRPVHCWHIGWRDHYPHNDRILMLREWLWGNLIHYYLHTPEGKPYRLTGAMP